MLTPVSAPRRDRATRRVLLDNVRRRLFGDVLGTTIGPYRLRRRIARGAMGSVFEAYDPRLRRDVALKVVDARGDGPDDVASMMAEARAIAALDHPNVVRVLDAGASPLGVWLAMERLDGVDLKSWLRRSPKPSTTEVLRVLGDVAAGLAAVHRADLVHRDVKPANAFVGGDGRVSLIDFGLAVTRRAARAELVGTLAYMSPEQHRGEPATARSDQYAWCVMAYEALYGRRPYGGRNADALLRLKMERPLGELPPRPDVSARIHRALLRGLSADPGARWPSMAPLIAAVRPPRWAAHKGTALATTLGALVVVGVAANRGTPQRQACLGELDWPDARRVAMKKAIEGDGSRLRRAAWTRLERRVDEFAREFERSRRAACRGGESRVVDRQLACLVRWRESFNALTAAPPVEAEVAETVAGVASLANPAACDGRSTSAESRWLPAPEGISAGVERVRADIAAAGARADAGHRREAHAAMKDAVAAARRVGFAPLVLEARFFEVLLRADGQDQPDAARDYEELYLQAVGQRHAYLEIRAAIMLARYFVERGAFAEANRWRRRAAAADDEIWPDLTVRRLVTESRYGDVVGDADLSDRASSRLSELADALDETGMKLTLVRSATEHLIDRGHGAQAHAFARRHLERASQALGEGHPRLGRYHNNVASAAWEAGRVEEAIDAHRRSLEYERTYNASRPYRFVNDLAVLATCFNELGRWPEASAVLRQLDDLVPPTVSLAAGVKFVLSMARATTAHGLGRLDDALDRFADAEHLVVDTFGPDHHWVGAVLAGKGVTLLERGDVEAALEALRRASRMSEELANSRRTAEVKFSYARALLAAGRAREAVLVAGQARDLIDDDHPATQFVVRRIDAWLAAHAPLYPG